MKKIAVFGIFWLLWQVPFAADPQLVEAKRYTSKQEFRTETKYCNEKGCTSSSSFSQSKQWDNRSNDPYSGGGGYYYAPPSGGGGLAPKITMPIDFRPLAEAMETIVVCVFTLGFGCP